MALSDVYSQVPFAPSQQLLQQQTEGARALPGLHQQGLQIQEQEAQAAAMKRPVTPWQKAIMRIMAGEDTAKVAADTKAELAAGGRGAPQGAAPNGQGSLMGNVQGPTQPDLAAPSRIPPSVSGAVFGQEEYNPSFNEAMSNLGGPTSRNQPLEPMRRPLPAAASFAADRNAPPQGMAAQRYSGPMKGGLQESDMEGMTGRDYQQFVSTYPSHRFFGSNTDPYALERLRQAGRLELEGAKGKTKKDITEMRINAQTMHEQRADTRAELDRRVKEGILSETERHNLMSERINWAKLQEAKNRFRMARSDNERIQAARMLLQYSAALEGAKSRVISSNTGLFSYSNEDIDGMMDEWETDAEMTKKGAEEFLKSVQSKTQVTEGESTKTPNVVKPPTSGPGVKNPFNK